MLNKHIDKKSPVGTHAVFFFKFRPDRHVMILKTHCTVISTKSKL